MFISGIGIGIPEERHVRRYDLKSLGCEAEMVESPEGNWVKFDDYEDLLEEVNRLRRLDR